MSTLLRDRVSIDYREHLAIVTLSRAEKYNGLDLSMMQALVEAAAQVRRRKDIRAVIIHGDGSAFCAGLDFASVTRKPLAILGAFIPWGRRANLFQRMCLVWRELPVPVIAVTHGYCFGGGMQLILGCDFRFSTPDCQFSIMEIQWGLIPDMSASVTLRELVPVDVAMELTMTGRKFTGQEALDLHLVTGISDTPMAMAEQLADTIASRSPDAIRASKQLFRRTWLAGERRALAQERKLQFGLLTGSNQREAMKANFEKRPPRFKT